MSKILEEIDVKFNSINENENVYYLLMENIDQVYAYDIMTRCEKSACRFYFSNGNLKIKKISSVIHNGAARAINKQLILQNVDGIFSGSVSCKINNNIIKEPDESFIPFEKKTSGPFLDGYFQEFPSLVIEIAHKNEEFIDELKSWVSDETTVNIAIGICIGKKFEAHNLLFYMVSRGGADIIKDLHEIKENE